MRIKLRLQIIICKLMKTSRQFLSVGLQPAHWVIYNLMEFRATNWVPNIGGIRFKDKIQMGGPTKNLRGVIWDKLQP